MCALELCRLGRGEQAVSARGRGTEGPGGGRGLNQLLGEQGRALQSQERRAGRRSGCPRGPGWDPPHVARGVVLESAYGQAA